MKRILILDEDPNMCLLLKLEMSDSGYEVFTENNIDRGLKILKNEWIDLIIMDVEFPRVINDMILNWMNRLQTETPVIIFSGNSGFKEFTDDDKFKYFVLKSGDTTLLKNKVHEII